MTRIPAGRTTPRSTTATAGIILGLLLASLSCGREVTGPERGVRQSRALAIQPEFRATSGDVSVLSGVPFARVRVTLVRLGGGVALDRVIDFPTDRDSVPLSLTVDLSADAPAEGEQMSLSLRFVTAAGDTVFRSGPDTLLVEPARAGAPPTAVVVRPIYVGPGSQATRVDLLPTSATTQGGNPLTFTAQAFDSQGSAVLDAPILFTSTDSTLVRFANARVGSATTFVRRGNATVIASLLTGPADSATVSTTLPAAAIAATQGSGQSGPAGSTLATPVTVRVTASDALGVPGVTVSFAAANGGSVGAAGVITDANGNASTTWTLGPAAGAQSMTATAVGLAGSPVTFTATASSTAATQLVFTTGPASAQAGASLGAITVTARDAQNNAATTFTGTVALAFGANPGSGTLAGTLTANAVAGVATFTGISVDRAAAGYTLVASSGALIAATSTAFAITPGAATTLAFSVQPPSAPASTPLVPAVQVVARDAFNNTATSFTGAVTLAFGANPSGATLGGTLVVNAVAGVAAFPGLTVSTIGVGYTLVASATGLASATSATFNTTAALIAWTNPAGGNWTTASNWSLGRVPNAIDSVVIGLAGSYTVTLDTTVTASFITVGGVSGAQTLALGSRPLTIAGELRTQGTGVFAMTNATLIGTGSLVNTATSSVLNSAINVPVVNSGTLTGNATVNLTAALTTTATSVLRARSDGTTGFVNFTVANGFTNVGALEITSAGFSASFLVTSGTLVNAPGGTISSLVEGGGTRTLTAAVDNQGLMTIAQTMTWGRPGAVHTNSGTIAVSAGNLDLNQSGGGGLTNTGTLSVGAGSAFITTGTAFTNTGGSIAGTGTLAFVSATATFTTDFSNATLDLTLNSSTVNGPGTLTNAAARTLSLFNSTINAPMVNAGTLTGNATVNLNGALTTTATSVLRARSDGSSGFVNLTVANGFTNLGAIELTSTGFSASFAVTNGTLVNAPGATITSVVEAGGTRTLTAAVDNQGLMTIAQAMTWGRTGGVHTNSGTIAVSGGNLDLTQSGGSLTNSGTITIDAGRALTTTNAAFTNNAGTITGAGTIAFASAVATFTTDFSNATLNLTLSGSTVNGPGTLTNATGRTLALFNTTINAPLVNAGTLIANAGATFNGALTTTATSVLRARSDGSSGFVNFTVANGFTNLGAIELTSAGFSASFAVTNGTLVNAPGATITSLVEAGGTRTLTAAVDNQGLMTIAQAMSWGRTGAVHTNSGTIAVSGGNLDLNQGGGGLTNTGTITIGAGRSLTTTGTAFTNSAGAITGTGTLAFASATATFTNDFSNATLDLTLNSSTVNGPGTLTNAAGRTLALFNTTINAPLVNAGTLIANAGATFNGALTTTATSVLRARSDGSSGFVNFTVANGFTNLGAIELTSAGFSASFAVTNGTLVNAPGATITSLVEAGGTRTLTAAVDNQGLMTIAQAMSWGRTGAVHTNSGTIAVSGGNLDLNQGGGGLTNTGTITIGAGRSLTTTGTAFTNSAGAITGTGTLAFASATATFTNDFSTGTLDLTLNSSTVNGPGTLTNAAGRTLALFNTTINAPLVNAGTLTGNATVNLNGALTTTATSVLRARSDGSSGFVNFTVANGFTNLGAIELTSAGFAATFAVTSGTLVNAPGATITSLVEGGGTRSINAAVVNQGTLAVSPGAASALAINGSLNNAGTIALDLGGLAAGAQYDQIAVTGTLVLDGTLDVAFFGGFVPVSTNSFTVLTNTGVRTGGFTNTILPFPLSPNPLYGANSVIVSVP